MSKSDKVQLLPRRLSQGDTVGVIAPAGPVSERDNEPGMSLLADRGFAVRPGRHLYGEQGYLAGDDTGRLEDLHEMFSDAEIKAIICARGGYGTMRLLETLDYELVSSNPKIFAGYSDITALLLSFYRKTGLVTFHGPMVRDCSIRGDVSMGMMIDLLQGNGTSSLPLSGTAVREGKAQGTLLGGNLTMICHLAGTPFMPPLDGCILFLEDNGEPVYRIDRMLTQLTLGGHLTSLAGLVAGEFTECGDQRNIEAMLGQFTNAIPVASGLATGHGPLNMTLPVGVSAELDTAGMTLRVTGNFFKE